MTHYQIVTVKKNAEEYLNSLNRDALIIYSPTSLAYIDLRNTKVHMIDSRVFGRNISLMEALCKSQRKYATLVSLGGGTATDVAKYIATKMNTRFVCIPSMLSTNSYATDKVALVVGEEKITLDAKLADEIILDALLIDKAPIQNLYGLADVLSIHTALFDWKLAHQDIGEALDDVIYRMAGKLLVSSIGFILGNDSQSIRQKTEQIFINIGESGHITNIYGSGRPESGSEHIFAKKLEKYTEVPHGVGVSLGIILMSILQGNYSPNLMKCLKKIGTLENLSEYKISRSTLIKVLLAVESREDRYSILDKTTITAELAEKIVDEFQLKLGVNLQDAKK